MREATGCRFHGRSRRVTNAFDDPSKYRNERRFNPRDEADFKRRRSVLDITTIQREEFKSDGFRSLGWTEAIFVRRAGRKNAMHKTLIRDVNRHSGGVDFTTYLDNEVPSEATHVFFIEPASGHLHAYFDCVFPRRSFYFPLLRPFLPLQRFQRWIYLALVHTDVAYKNSRGGK